MLLEALYGQMPDRSMPQGGYPDRGLVGIETEPTGQDDSPFLNIRRQRAKRERNRKRGADSELIVLAAMAIDAIEQLETAQ